MGFSEQLKKARLAAGLTQYQVAEKMDITPSTYCGYETGKRQPDVAKIKQLAQILNTPGDTLLETGYKSFNADDIYTPLKFALWGGDADFIDDEMIDDVKLFAKMLAERKRRKGAQNER